jgi:hypothetical protein
MISRRSFLKLSGLAVFALGAGYKTGEFLSTNYKNKFSIYAFLPEDIKIIGELLKIFKNKIDSGFITSIEIDNDLKNFWQKINSPFQNKNLFSNNQVKVNLNRIKNVVNSDILICNSEKHILNPDLEFERQFSLIRKKINGRIASLSLSLEYGENNFLSSLFKTDYKTAIIENEKGKVDKINLNKNYKNIEIPGSNGKIFTKIENGFLKVYKSSCRHKICEKSGYISQPGDVIACAPNKIIIRIENT